MNKLNKKGVTVVEILVSFALTVTIFIFLIQIIVNLTKVYNNNDKKTKLLMRQAMISDKLNTVFREKKLNNIEKIDENNYRLYYKNGERDTLKINNGKMFRFEELALTLEGGYYGVISVDVVYSPTILSNSNNAIFILTIPITSDVGSYDVKVLYQFNTENSYIDEYFN